MSEACAIAPLVLWSDRFEGNLYLVGKNTFLDFYTDANKALKRSARARSASADSHLQSWDRFSTHSTATPTDRSSSPSNSSELGSDNEVTPFADLQSPDATPRANTNRSVSFDANDEYPATIAEACEWDPEHDIEASSGCPVMMSTMTTPHANENQRQPHVVKPLKANGGNGSRANFAKQDLERPSRVAAVDTQDITALMITGLPSSLSQEAITSTLDASGLAGKYNFLYFAQDAMFSSNQDYVLVMNFVDQQSADLCITTFAGAPFAPALSFTTSKLPPAALQGLSKGYQHFLPMTPSPPCESESRAALRPPRVSERQAATQPQVVKPRKTKDEAESLTKTCIKKRPLKKDTDAPGEITTLMMRGIPCSIPQEDLMGFLDNSGLKGKYNFFYLPRDKKGSNFGYAFVNFVSQEDAELCIETFKGVKLLPYRSQKICTVSPADIQGLTSLRKHFNRTAVQHGPHRPMFLTV